MVPAWGCVIGVCIAEILGLAGYSIVPALLPQIMEDWSLNGAQGGWLAEKEGGRQRIALRETERRDNAEGRAREIDGARRQPIGRGQCRSFVKELV